MEVVALKFKKLIQEKKVIFRMIFTDIHHVDLIILEEQFLKLDDKEREELFHRLLQDEPKYQAAATRYFTRIRKHMDGDADG